MKPVLTPTTMLLIRVRLVPHIVCARRDWLFGSTLIAPSSIETLISSLTASLSWPSLPLTVDGLARHRSVNAQPEP